MSVRPLDVTDATGALGPGRRRLARPIRVGVRADDPVTDAGLRRWVRGSSSELALVREVADADVVVLAVDRRSPQDIRTVTDELRTANPSCSVVVVADAPRGGAPAGEQYGVNEAILRDELSHDGLVAAALRATGQWVPPPADRDASPVPVDETDDGHGVILNERERAVLRLLADGVDLAETARTLSYSERTVKNILYTMLGRLGLKNRVHAVSYAIRHELI